MNNAFVTLSQTTAQTIGSSANRLAKLWASEVEANSIKADEIINITKIIPSSSSLSVRNAANNTDNLTILDSGRVGINVTNPSVTLDVNGSVRFGATSGGTNNGHFIFNKDDRYPNLQFRNTTSIAAQVLTDVSNGNVYYDTIGAFYLRNAINGGDILFSALNNGRVGVGTTIPDAKFDVIGDIQARTGRLRQTGIVTLSTPGPSLISTNGTLIGSDAGQQSIIAAQANLSPNVATGTLSVVYGLLFLPTFRDSSNNITNVIGIFNRTDLNSTYT